MLDTLSQGRMCVVSHLNCNNAFTFLRPSRNRCYYQIKKMLFEKMLFEKMFFWLGNRNLWIQLFLF